MDVCLDPGSLFGVLKGLHIGVVAGAQHRHEQVGFAVALLEKAGNAEGTISNDYNAANRLAASEGTAPSGTVNYAYFPAGQVSNVSSVAGSTTYSLDGADRVDGITTLVGTYGYAYDTNWGLVSTASNVSTGIEVEYGYDDLDRVTSITWRNASNDVLRSFAYEYTAAGMIESVTRESGESFIYGYDTLDRLTTETQMNAWGGTSRSESLQYDLVGNRTSKTRDGVTVNYALGTGNRLSSWAVSGSYSGLTMDVVGHSDDTIGTGERYGELWVSNSVAVTPATEGTNFWAYGMVIGLGTQQVSAAICDDAGNMDYVTNSVFLTVATNGTYLLDTAGCVTAITYTGTAYTNTTELSWNGQYQLTSVDVDGSTVEQYAYDALGRRSRVITGNTTNHLIYDGVHVIAEVNATGGVLRSYTWGLGVDNLLAMSVPSGATTNDYFMLTDHLGTVHAVADEDGEIVESYRYDAWGRVLGVYDENGAPLVESAIGNDYLWQGRWYSWETGLYYFRARWYDPVTGRWLSKDPVGISGGLNQYVFCGNNPVNSRDPLGLCDDGGNTHRVGITVSFECLIAFNFNVGWAWSRKDGRVTSSGVVLGGGLGVGLLSASLGGFYEGTDADVVEDLEGYNQQSGLSLGNFLVGGGGDWIVGLDDDPDSFWPRETYHGTEGNIGVAGGLPVSGHVLWGGSVALGKNTGGGRSVVDRFPVDGSNQNMVRSQ